MTVSKSEKKLQQQSRELTLHFYQGDLAKILRHEFLIRNCIKQKKKIPSKLINLIGN
jgi:hypothetical protein